MTGGLPEERRVHLIQGEWKVSGDPSVIFVTLLGSCVAACIRDATVGVGGMNHFLLPGGQSPSSGDGERYGVHLMELLLNGLMKMGAHRDRMEAKIFGGARMMRGLTDVGSQNAEFAARFLSHEGIKLVGKDLGGERGRRLQYSPTSGRARQSYIAAEGVNERAAAIAPAPVSAAIELF